MWRSTRWGKEAGAIVNVVDRLELANVTTPSIVDRIPLVVATRTEGNAPVLGRVALLQSPEC